MALGSYPQTVPGNYRKDYRILTIGLSYKVPVIESENHLQSARETPYKVPVDKLLNPQG